MTTMTDDQFPQQFLAQGAGMRAAIAAAAGAEQDAIAADLRGADDDRPVTLQRLNGQDRATLRWFTGQPTLQDWLDRAPEDRGDVPPPVAIRADVPLRMAARLKAVQDAQTMIRLCPTAYIPQVRP